MSNIVNFGNQPASAVWLFISYFSLDQGQKQLDIREAKPYHESIIGQDYKQCWLSVHTMVIETYLDRRSVDQRKECIVCRCQTKLKYNSLFFFNKNLYEGRKIRLGVCAMAKKVKSKPMHEILKRLSYFAFLEIVIFEEEVITKLLIVCSSQRLRLQWPFLCQFGWNFLFFLKMHPLLRCYSQSCVLLRSKMIWTGYIESRSQQIGSNAPPPKKFKPGQKNAGRYLNYCIC